MENNLYIKDLYMRLDNNYKFRVQFNIHRRRNDIEYIQALKHRDFVSRKEKVTPKLTRDVDIDEPFNYSLILNLNKDDNVVLRAYKRDKVKHLIFSNNSIEKYKDRIQIQLKVGKKDTILSASDFINLVTMTYSYILDEKGVKKYIIYNGEYHTQWILYRDDLFEIWQF